MKKLKGIFFLALICSSLLACNSNVNNIIALQDIYDPEVEIAATETKARPNKYMCVTLSTGGGHEIVKVLNLQTKEMISLPVPGFVRGMSSAMEDNIIYVNAVSSDENYYSLYKLDLAKRKVERILSFNQLGIRPSHFVVEGNNVFVSGKRSGAGAFYGNDLLKNQWFAIANNISPGRIELGFTKDTYHVVSFDDDYVTRTIVNVPRKQITARKTIKHSVPFGNNVFIPSPHGRFVYVLHQHKDSFRPYAFNLKQGTEHKFSEIKTGGGLLYSAIISNNGKHLFTNVNREIYHYRLEDEKLVELPKIELKIPESRNMAMANDNQTLYITHETGSNLSVIKFSSDYRDYTVSNYFIGGSSNEIYLF